MFAALARPYRADVTWSNVDPRWYANLPSGGRSDAGVTVTADKAISISTVYRGIMVLANAIASMPLFVYERVGEDEKRRAPDNPSYPTLHDRPNPWMTSAVWRRLMVKQRILHGNHYSEIVPVAGGVELHPLDPNVTRVVRRGSDGKKVFVTQDVLPDGRYGAKRAIHQDEMLHVMSEFTDEQGLMGVGLIQVARNAMGLSLAGERHGSMFLRKGARLSGIASVPGRMDEEQRKINEAALNRAYGGVDATGSIALTTGGMKFESVTANNKDSQWLELRHFQVEDMLRFLGVPGVLCNFADKTATYASAEQFFLSNVVYGIGPMAVDIAQELNKSVVIGAPDFYAEFKLEGLLRGDIRTRYGAHQIAIQSGFMTRNEIRVIEGLNKGPDELDEFLEPVAVAQAPDRGEDDGGDDPPPRRQPTEDGEDDSEQAKRLNLIAHRAVERLVRKEVAAIAGGNGKMGAAQRFAANPDGWRAWLVSFYDEQATRMTNDLGLDARDAQRYTADQRTRLSAGIPANFEQASVNAMLALLED